MSRPVTISNDTILKAARALFVAKGPRATTAEIAARARVSEGMLFKRFGSKAGLHKAAMTSGIAREWIERQMRAQGPLRTRKDLARFIRWEADVLRNVVPVVTMAWASSRSHADEVPKDLTGPEPAPLVAIHTLAAMLQEQMDAGHLAQRNAEAVARTIIGSLWHFVFLEIVFDKARGRLEGDTFMDELARVVFGGIDPAHAPDGNRRVR